MENKKREKQRREKVNFTISENTEKLINEYISDNPVNKSKLLEKLILEHINKNSI